MSGIGWDHAVSPVDQNNRYVLDSVGLQLGLDAPLQLLGISLISDMSQPNHPDSASGGLAKITNNQRPTNSSIPNLANTIQQTVDGIPIRKVYVTNINIEVRRQDLYYIFTSHGRVVNVFLAISKNDPHKQFAFVTFYDPKDAARVLAIRRFKDFRGRSMFATPADSWHQPKEGPDGKIMWHTDRKEKVKQEEESEEEDDQCGGVAGSPVEETEVVNEQGLNLLNDDCLLHIFSYLSYKQIAGIERVCKRWQALSFQKWRCLHELRYIPPTFAGMEIKTATLEQYLKRCGTSLRTLDLSVTNNNFSESTLAIIARYCCNLKVLKVSHMPVGNRSLAHLGRRCPDLTQLFIDGCSKFNDQDMMSLLPKCAKLNHLDLSHSNGITGKCLANIQGPINSLKLHSCPALESYHIIAGLEKMSQSLKSLTLSNCSNLRSCDIDRIVSAVPNLTSFCLRRFTHFEYAGLTSLSRLSQLTTLNLSQNSAVGDSVLSAIVEGCGSLTTLNLCGSGSGSAEILSERGLSTLAHLSKLVDLDISYLEATNSTALKKITTKNSHFRRLICRGCPDLSDEGSCHVVSMCNELELFDLSGCGLVTLATVSAAKTSLKMRTNNIPLLLIVGGTEVGYVQQPDKEVPLLSLNFNDLSDEHMRPDYINDMFFPPSDSEDEEDLDHLCERIVDIFDEFHNELFLSDYDEDSDYDDDNDFDYELCDILNLPWF